VAKAFRRSDANAARRQKLQAELGQLTDAIAGDLISAAVVQRLKVVEVELVRLAAEAARPKIKVIDFPGKLSARVRKAAENMMGCPHRESDRARAAVLELVGEIPCAPDETGRFLVVRIGMSGTCSEQ